MRLTGCRRLVFACLVATVGQADEGPAAPVFALVQPELFAAPGAQPNAWADYDGDGDLDLFVGFRGAPDRLYRNDDGVFVNVAAAVGVASPEETRAAAWGDWDADGDPDLYVGFAALGIPNRLFRNDGGHFVDVAGALGVTQSGTTRQPAFLDYDGDGDLDLFVAFRDRPNMLFRHDGAKFTDVTEAAGIGDPRRTVSVAWFDMDGDGDLDAFVANQDGDEDGMFRNRGDGTFEDVAPMLGMQRPGRTATSGSVGTAVADYDNDGDLDLFVASYGPDVLWQNRGDGRFVDVAPGTVLAGDHHSVAAAWADFNGDGYLDLYVDTFLSAEAEARDYLFQGSPRGFAEVLPDDMAGKGASHGVAWADFDSDGDLDLALANNHADGSHPLYRNKLAAAVAARSLQVVVVDRQGRQSRAGATVTLTRPADGFTTSRLVDTGGGYSSQGAVPVHFTWPAGDGLIDIAVCWYEAGMLRTRITRGIRPADYAGKILVIEAEGI